MNIAETNTGTASAQSQTGSSTSTVAIPGAGLSGTFFADPFANTTAAQDPGRFVFQETATRSARENLTPGGVLNTNATVPAVNETHTPVTLYEYMMGVKDIQLTHETYQERQVYVTKPLEVSGNVMEIELDATENHPVFDSAAHEALAGRLTSIEYYLTHKERPEPEDWIPLLPKSQATVIGERLFFAGTQATLRFPAELASLVVYQNGVRLPADRVTLLSVQSLAIVGFQSQAIYTADYAPNTAVRNPWVFSLGDYAQTLRQATETFAGASYNNTITLSRYPYVDMARIVADNGYEPNTSAYKPVRVRLTDAVLQGKNNTLLKTVEPYAPELLEAAYTRNRTLYKDKSWSDLQAYQPATAGYYGGFDYYHWKNKLTFTERFNAPQTAENKASTHGTATIAVDYEYLAYEFRLKVILRRNTAEQTSASPELSDYTMYFKTMN